MTGSLVLCLSLLVLALWQERRCRMVRIRVTPFVERPNHLDT